MWSDPITQGVCQTPAYRARLACDSPQGRALASELTLYLSAQAWRDELDALRALDQWASAQVVGELGRALRELPELDALERRLLAGEALRDEDLFALKRALYIGAKLLEQAATPLASLLDDVELTRARCDTLMRAIHPEPSPTPRFFLSDELDEALAQARADHRAAKKAAAARARELEAGALERYPQGRFDLEGVLRLPAHEHAQIERASLDPQLRHKGQGWIIADDELDHARLAQHERYVAMQAQEAAVRLRITQRLASPAWGWIKAMIEALTRLDLRLAKVKLRRQLDGAWPQLADDGRIRAHLARSPSLSDAQPLDLELEPARGVVITGPNMGGKSEALKLIGLLQWCLQHAMPAPAASYQAPMFSALVYVGADERVAAGRSPEGLSAFGREIRRIVEQRAAIASPPALWLLDEPCRGTHPLEGELLATQIIELLLADGHQVLAVTHLPKVAAMEGVQRLRTVGLKPRDQHDLEAALREASPDDLEGMTRALRASMDYRLVLTDAREQVPRDARRIARALGLGDL